MSAGQTGVLLRGHLLLFPLVVALLVGTAFGRAVVPEVFSAASPVLARPPSWQTAASMLAFDADGNRVFEAIGERY